MKSSMTAVLIALVVFGLVFLLGFLNHAMYTPTDVDESVPLPQSNVPEKWTGCASTAECVKVWGFCDPEAVNTKFQTEFEAFAEERRKPNSCPYVNRVRTAAVCTQNQCALVAKVSPLQILMTKITK